MREVRNNANFPKMVEHVDKNVGMIFNKSSYRMYP